MAKYIRITKEFDFEMAHALDFHDGKCRNIHGHSYKLAVTLKGIPKENKTSDAGMVMDFGDLKKIVKSLIVDQLDHALVLEENSPYLTDNIKKQTQKLVLVDYQPTCENMLLDFKDRLKNVLPKDVELLHLKLRETATGYAEWFSEDN